MAYDGKIMRRALQRYEADRQARQEDFRRRQERIFSRQPRLREIQAELRTVPRFPAGVLLRLPPPKRTRAPAPANGT